MQLNDGPQNQGQDPRTDEELMIPVRLFSIRARRVMTHSICQDEETLTDYADGRMIYTRKDGRGSLTQALPREEALESLAARVRPFTLQGDPVHYASTLKALSAYLRREEHHADVAWCKTLRREWRDVDFNSPRLQALSMSWEPGKFEERTQATDNDLAHAWFYGDLVHADKPTDGLDPYYDIDHRYRAAAVRTCQIAILARDTYHFIRALSEAGVIPLDLTEIDDVKVAVSPNPKQLVTVLRKPSGPFDPDNLPEELAGDWEDAFPGKEDTCQEVRMPWGVDNADERSQPPLSNLARNYASIFPRKGQKRATRALFLLHNWCLWWCLDNDYAFRIPETDLTIVLYRGGPYLVRSRRLGDPPATRTSP